MPDLAAEGALHLKGEDQIKAFGHGVSWPLDTPGGRYYAEWDSEAPVTREGQLMFFFQFLQAGGRWEELLKDCPLKYRGNRGSGAPNVLGTILLSVLCGHWRYAHINSVRGDQINPALLGLGGTVSEDAVRAAMKRLEEKAGLDWLGAHLRQSIAPALSLPWILDIDTTIKTLYGHQQGAQVGYNAHKPGRPSHVYHSYFVANLRICLGVEVRPGKEHAGGHGLPQLWESLGQLPRERWPTYARGDCGYGHEAALLEFEEQALPYLFKLRHTAKVKSLIKGLMGQGAWQDAGEGWEVRESSLRLQGWSRSRRVVLVRENPALAPGNRSSRPRALRGTKMLRGSENWPSQAAPWCGKIAVLVTSLEAGAWPAMSLAGQYRQRADAENNYDELKNQWGWNGFTTRQMGPCRLMANFIALVYNWWNLYVRLYDEEHHREAISSRPVLMQGVGRRVQSGGQRTIKISLVHEKSEEIRRSVSATSQLLHRIGLITERWSTLEKWTLLLTRVLRRWLGGKWLPGLPPEAHWLLSG